MENTTPILDDYFNDIQEVTNQCLVYTGDSLKQQITKDMQLMQLVKKWKPVLGFDSKIIETHLDRSIIRATIGEETTIKSYTYQDIRDWDAQGSFWLVPGLLLKSALYFWYGIGKHGKSTTVLSLIHAVLVSGNFLGYPVIKGPVLWIDLEQGRGLVKMNMERMGFNDLTNDSARILLSANLLQHWRNFDLKKDLSVLAETLDNFKPVLVVIDSFRKALTPAGLTDTDHEAVVLAYQLQSLFLNRDCTGIMIHHATKGGVMAGHNGLYGANDGLASFEKVMDETTGQSCVRMKTIPRFGEPQSILIGLKTGLGGRKQIYKIREENTRPELQSMMDTISMYLSKYIGVGFLFQELQERLPGSHRVDLLEEALIRLQELQILEVSVEHPPNSDFPLFRYYLPKDSAWHNNGNLLQNYITDTNRKAALLLGCRNASDLYYLLSQWSKAETLTIYRTLAKVDQERLKQVRDTYTYDVGSKVIYQGEQCTIKQRQEGRYLIEPMNLWVFEHDLDSIEDEPNPSPLFS